MWSGAVCDGWEIDQEKKDNMLEAVESLPPGGLPHCNHSRTCVSGPLLRMACPSSLWLRSGPQLQLMSATTYSRAEPSRAASLALLSLAADQR